MTANPEVVVQLNELADSQRNTGNIIESIIRNFKKDPVSRKTCSYFEERLRRLDVAWSEFETTDSKLRCLENVPLDHAYFVEDYYKQISELTFRYKEIFESLMLNPPAANQPSAKAAETNSTTAGESNQPAAANKTTTTFTAATNPPPGAEPKSAISAIRRQKVMVASLTRLLAMDPTADNMKLKEKLWEQIQDLHFSIWECSQNPINEGYDMKSYTTLEKQIIENFKLSSQLAPAQIVSPQQCNVPPQQCNVLPLPKVSIPKFNGDYLKWRSFFDLFSQLVDNQQIPTIQKMWYLRSNVTGEAEKLISHLSATSENYETAFKMLKDRYNNKRVLVSSIIQQLLDQPSGGSSAAAIKQLHDTTKECMHALQNIGIDISSWDPILLHLLVKKLDRTVHSLYERSITDPKELQQVKHLLAFLESHFQSMEAMGGHKEKTSSKTCTPAAVSKQSENSCALCKNGQHPLYRCQGFQHLTPPERLNFTQRQKLCVNCLRAGHSAKNCSLRPCTKCNKKHNSLLHLEFKDQRSNQKPTNGNNNQAVATLSTKPEADSRTESISNASEATSLAAANNQSSNSYVLLGTALIKIKTDHTEIECRALLDSGSQINCITERLVKRLGISMQLSSVNINGIGATNTKTQHRVNVALESRINGFSTRLEALVLPSIISQQPSQLINVSEWSIPKNLVLADPNFNRPSKVDILLGAEHYFQLLSIGQIELSKHLPILQNTLLGWVVSGKVQGGQSTDLVCGVCTTDQDLETAISKLWELDEIKTTEKPLTIAERKCEQHFAQHTIKNHENRFIVRIPFHQAPDALGDSHGVALNRFLSLERRLQKDPELKAQYIKFMDEYESMGHMTKVSADDIPSPNYFIPHHCVLRPESSTTKLRVVFDASAKTSSGHSLNDLMYAGPTVQSELFSILLRFRFPRFVFTTDVEKMYRQVLISPEDRQFQLIIWRKNALQPITYYQLNTVTYGTRSAPYLATRCLQQLAKENAARYPLASEFIQENFYVDDGLGGADTLTSAIHLQEQLKQIMKEGGFNLRKWCANHPQLLQNIPQGDLEVNLNFESNRAESIKTLGLTWLPKDDKLCVKVNIDPIKRVTKRIVASDLARLFDPLGILSPIVVTAKMFIQELWELKIDWDQSLPESMHSKWIAFRTELNALTTLQISRHIFKGAVPTSFQLHIFTDASEKAYGAAAYIRSVFKDGTIITRLLCAKSRVAPLKRQTIPRLELCAAVLGAQLATRIKADLQLTNPIWFWTDSEIVLSWINSPASLTTFVANRISIIHEATQAEQWRHVSSKCNPADVLSRGLSPAALKECTLWFCGPLFLHGKEAAWPPKFSPNLSTPTNLERKRKAVESLVASESEPVFIYKINHKNSFLRLQRIVGYVLRFINHVRCKKDHRQTQTSLTVAELSQALLVIIKQMQASDFKDEIQQLKRYKQLRGMNNLCNLSPFLDSSGLIRVGGRLEASSLPYDSKHQLLIPYNDPIARLMFEMTHRDNKHCGAQTLLGTVRQRFWPIKGKIMARSTVQRCIRCSKAKPALFRQIMGNLPSTRVTPARPFINCGVDYCGPITVHYKLRGKRPHKAYIAVFCCFATKAVHLELVSDLTTEAFIGALKRFIARRGHCQNLYCDNATNFVGAKARLSELSSVIYEPKAQEAITNACSKEGIQFNFIPPRAPHFGGLWEAAVKSAKHLLIRSLANASLTYEEFETLIIEIEAILNSRPISPISNDPNDVGALTPGHFLIGEPLTAQIDAQAAEPNTTLATRWKLVSRLKHNFWNQWSRDYLNELQYRNKWKEQSKNLQPGAIVIIKEDNTPVMKWPLGRVIKIYKGSDEVVRVADVKTASGVYKRAVHYLAPLPRSEENDEDKEESIEQSSNEQQPDAQPSTPSPDETPRSKRRRSSAPVTMATLIIALLALPLILAKNIEITEFEPKIGIHFEEIGTIRISQSEWNIISYYELQPYWKEINAFTNGTLALRHLCNLIKQKASCINVLETLEFDLRELQNENILLKRNRVKRGAMNIIGNVANSLFGVLDSDYAEQMSDTIYAITENESYLKNLLNNQTSIINATLNIFKQNELQIEDKFKNLDAQITAITSRLHENQEEVHQTKLFQIFMSLSIQLSITSSRLHRIQSEIVAALSDSHHGRISPQLLSPSQLEDKLVQVRNHLPTSLQMPVMQNNLLQLYKIMGVKGGITENHVIFHITLPLCNPETFDMFKPHPIPVFINRTFITIKPCSELMAITAHRDQHIILTERQWRSCQTIKENEFICPNIQSTFNSDAKQCLCDIALLNNITHTKCNTEIITDDTSFTQLEHNNQWMYTLRNRTRITAVCGQEHSQLTLKGSGLLKINPDCTLKHKSIVMKGHQSHSSSIQSSYTATANIMDIVPSTQIQSLLEDIHITNYTDQLQNISDIQRKLHQQVLTDLPSQIRHIKYHHATVSYAALSITIVLIIMLIYKRVRNRKIELNQQIPSPASRQHVPSRDFAVSVT